MRLKSKLALLVAALGITAFTTASAVRPPETPVALKATLLAGITYDHTAPLDAKVKPLFTDTANPPKYPAYSVNYVGGNGQTVPATLTMPEAKPTGKVPAVIVLHGLGGRKTDMLLPGIACARRGYAVFAIDIAGHGDRPLVQGKAVSEQSLEGMREIAAQTVIDLRRAVDYLQSRPDIDSDHIGFVGVSLGGILGGVFAGNEPRLKGVVLWASGGDWGKLITTSQHAFAKRYRDMGTNDPAKIEAVMQDVDPLRYIGNTTPRPLLFLNGTDDTIVPRPCTDELYAAAKDPKSIKFVPGGHVELGAMMSETLNWLDENVKK